MSTLMAERRRPLENDDGQGSLFGGDAFGAEHPWDAPSARAGSADAPELSAPPAPAFEAPEVSEPRGFEAAEAPESHAPEVSFPPASDAPDAAVPPAPADADATFNAALDVPASARHAPAVPTEVPAHDELIAGEELSALEQATVPAADPRSPRNPRAPLAGPTLDDVMSRVWEGLATGLPAACPVCHGEVVASTRGPAHGRCTSCGTTIE